LGLTNFGLKIVPKSIMNNPGMGSFNETLKGHCSKVLIMSAFIFINFFIGSGCSSQKSQVSLNNDWIRFGHGGGVMGKEYTSVIEKGGKIRLDGVHVGSLSKNQKSQLNKNMETLGIYRLVYNEPGNLYRFLEVEDPSQGWRRIVWDPGSSRAPAGLNLIYEFLEDIKNKRSQ
jgi:hypothetical protein